MALFKSYTRGGQVAMHNLRMFKQVFFITLGFALVTALATFSLMTWRTTTPYQWYLYQEKIIGTHFTWGNPADAMTTFNHPHGAPVPMRVHDLLHNRWFRYQNFIFEKNLKRIGYISLYGALGVAILVIAFFVVRGCRQKKKEVVRGETVIKAQSFNKLLGQQKSDLQLAGCHLVKNAEMEHMLIAGSTGVGKTNCLHELLPQIRVRGDRAIIVDLRGNLLPSYYRPGHDILLNPFDARSEPWHIWAECQESYQFDTMAEILLPADKASSGDHEWWLKAGRAMFSVTAQKMAQQQNFSIKDLKNYLIALPAKDILPFFKGTDMASFASKESVKVTASVRNVLTPAMRKIANLKEATHAFSIRDWILKDKGDEWLFLTAGSDQQDVLQPLVSAWMSWAVQSLKTMPETRQPRMWFICDELPQLKYLPGLEAALAEIRGFGGCFVAGIQDFHQLQNIYGYDSAHTLLTLFNTKIVFNCPDKKTASYMAGMFGEQEIKERSESLSFGANDMRDGVSLNEQKKVQAVIKASDLMNLPKLSAYLKTPGQRPPVHLHFQYQQTKATQPRFIEAPKNEDQEGKKVTGMNLSQAEEETLSDHQTLQLETQQD